MSANLQKLELYKDFIIDHPAVHNHDWDGEIIISVVDQDDKVIARTAIYGDPIKDYQERSDGSLEVHLNGEKYGYTWVVDTPKNAVVKSVDLLLYPEKDTMLAKIPLTSLRNIDFVRETPLFNVYAELPNVLVFPAPTPL